MSGLAPARKLALKALVEANQTGSYVRDILSEPSFAAADERDHAFAMRLALGVTATSGCLDELLDCFIARPKKMTFRCRTALRIAAFELVYLGTDAHIAVSQGVEAVRSVARGATGLANAVLHRVAEHGCEYLSGDFCDFDSSCTKKMVSDARRSGMPVWLFARVHDSLTTVGDQLPLASALEPAPVWLHSFDDAVTGSLAQEFCGCWGPVNAFDLRRFAESGGDYVVSDRMAQLIACSSVRPGSYLEIGSGRGTKTFMGASHARHVGVLRSHVAIELCEHKCELNRARLSSAGFNDVRVVVGDGTNLEGTFKSADIDPHQTFDTVFVDAPCSGTGTMRRHPEIPWRLSPQDVDVALPALQLSMLTEASMHVGPGGELIYATCSVLMVEDLDVVNAFLASKAGSDFELAPVSGAWIFNQYDYASARACALRFELGCGCILSVPHERGDGDGHFCARLVRAR